MFMPAAGEVLIEFLFLYFGSARGTGRSFESRSRHKHMSLAATARPTKHNRQT